IYRAMGQPWSRQTIIQKKNLPNKTPEWIADTSYYLWQMLFDCQQIPSDGDGRPESSTFTCPEVLNAALGASPTCPHPKARLFTLKLMNHVRFQKRGLRESDSKKGNISFDATEKFFGPRDNKSTKKTITHAVADPASLAGDTALIIWYVTESK